MAEQPADAPMQVVSAGGEGAAQVEAAPATEVYTNYQAGGMLAGVSDNYKN